MRRTLNLLQSVSATLHPHPGLTLYPSFLSQPEQSLLLQHSLTLLSSPSRTSSSSRKRIRNHLKQHPNTNKDDFLPDEVYQFESGHFDGVIQGYREMLIRPGMFDSNHLELGLVLRKIYGLLPAPSSSSTLTSTNDPPSGTSSAISPSTYSTQSGGNENVDPPDHLIMHLLHLSSEGEIRPHVDHLEAFGNTIVGISLGGKRIMRFKRTCNESEKDQNEREEKDEFQVLLEPGQAYVQQSVSSFRGYDSSKTLASN